MKNFTKYFATLFGIGFIPLAPGTFGSLFAILIWYVFIDLFSIFYFIALFLFILSVSFYQCLVDKLQFLKTFSGVEFDRYRTHRYGFQLFIKGSKSVLTLLPTGLSFPLCHHPAEQQRCSLIYLCCAGLWPHDTLHPQCRGPLFQGSPNNFCFRRNRFRKLSRCHSVTLSTRSH